MARRLLYTRDEQWRRHADVVDVFWRRKCRLLSRGSLAPLARFSAFVSTDRPRSQQGLYAQSTGVRATASTQLRLAGPEGRVRMEDTCRRRTERGRVAVTNLKRAV